MHQTTLDYLVFELRRCRFVFFSSQVKYQKFLKTNNKMIKLPGPISRSWMDDWTFERIGHLFHLVLFLCFISSTSNTELIEPSIHYVNWTNLPLAPHVGSEAKQNHYGLVLDWDVVKNPKQNILVQ